MSQEIEASDGEFGVLATQCIEVRATSHRPWRLPSAKSLSLAWAIAVSRSRCSLCTRQHRGQTYL